MVTKASSTSNSVVENVGRILADIFVDITKASNKMDSIAGRIFEALAQAKANTLEKFELLIAAAYAANNWQLGGGRPAAERDIVPGAVKTYVSELRAAYGLKLPVLAYTSLELLRRDIRSKRQRILSGGVDGAKAPALAGLAIGADSKLNGAVFHDLAVVYLKLSSEQRQEMESALQRVLKKAMSPVKGLFSPPKPEARAVATLH
jgi:hypothetical protein